jgi:hypothetical protein
VYNSRSSFATVPGAQTLFILLVVSGRGREVGMCYSANMDTRQVEAMIDGLSQQGPRRTDEAALSGTRQRVDCPSLAHLVIVSDLPMHINHDPTG